MSKERGIDVSYWQGNIDWKKVKEDGITFAVLREGYRQTIDQTFLRNTKGAKAQGLVVMVYHFIYTDCATPEQNAQSTVRNMKSAGLDVAQTMVFADLEYDTWKKNGEKCTREKCTEYTERYLNELKKLGCKKLGIYLNIDYYRNYYTEQIKKAYPLWLADYTGGADFDCIMQQTSSSGRVSGISGNVDMDILFDDSYMDGNTQEGGNTTMGVTAQDILNIMRSWIGYSEANRKYIEILNIYNSHKPLARGYAIKPHDEWCDATVSACAIKAGAVELIGTEVGVERHVDIFKEKGIWIEDGSITPQAGDVIVFNWDGTSQPNNGYSDHIGYVESVSGGVITTIEGNSGEMVRRKTYRVGQACIRGYARPRYSQSSKPVQPSKPNKKDITTIAKEVVQGLWGNGEDRKNRLQSAGYDFNAVQQEVNRLLSSSSKPTLKPLSQVAKEVLKGLWGNGTDRKNRLESAGYDYNAVQAEVNRLAGASSVDINAIAKDVIKGKYGNGKDRRNALVVKYGSSIADAVQRRVNQLL